MKGLKKGVQKVFLCKYAKWGVNKTVFYVDFKLDGAGVGAALRLGSSYLNYASFLNNDL
jgi:hypothetical protein